MGASEKIRQWKALKLPKISKDWITYPRPIDLDIRYAMPTIRALARELAQNSDHAKAFLRAIRTNIVGPKGFVMKSRAETRDGRPDLRLRARLEALWKDWSKRGNCEVSGKFSWRSLQNHLIETVGRDGEAFLRILSPYPNRWGFALQVIDPESVDLTHHGVFEGREIRMGVEIDAWRRPVAYYVRGEPTMTNASYTVPPMVRVPANEIIHVYLPEFTWQTRGVSWLAVSSHRLHMITGAEDAEITASRASAAKFGAYESEEWAPVEEPPPDLVDETGQPLNSDEGQFVENITPGSLEIVPRGYRLRMYDPQHPNANMPEFLKWALRSISSGLGISYNFLGSDAEHVNYTSLRYFQAVEHGNWKELQEWCIEDLPEIVQGRWLENQLLLGNLPANRRSELSKVVWQPRRWDGPDPLKQSQADKIDLGLGTITLTEIFSRKGLDFDDVIAERINELKRAKEMAEKEGLTLEMILPYLTEFTGASNDETED